MCGLTGFWQLKEFDIDYARKSVCAMGDAITHRGPDDAGNWVEGYHDQGVAFSHARLSIIDISPTGHQPMMSNSGRFVLLFNGEIYNHHALREEIGSYNWKGYSDTETLLACIELWGLKVALKRANGMFALVVWDRKQRKLLLARDRLGEKPLYYGWNNGVFLFGSELKAFKKHPKFKGQISRNSLALFLRHNYVPSPYSIYIGIYKLTPGTMLELDSKTSVNTLPDPIPYWSISQTTKHSNEIIISDDSKSVSYFEDILKAAVRQQMIADVPIGAFLSGGIDSSTIVALMQSQSPRKINTYSIGFHEQKYDEAKYASAVAKNLGTDHNELYITSKDALSIIPDLPNIYDEPFADPSQIPTFLLSKFTSGSVKVALSGDGGDEILGGYTRYSKAEKMWGSLSKIPVKIRPLLSSIIKNYSESKLIKIHMALSKLSHGESIIPYANKLSLLAEALNCVEDLEYYLLTIAKWRHPSSVVIEANEPSTILSDRTSWPNLECFRCKMMYADLHSYLPDNILIKVDRAAMSVGLETRVPLLDFRVVEAAWGLPQHMIIRNGQTKWILRKVLSKYMPDKLFDRPKMGFGVPINSWLGGSLRGWAESLLDEDRLRHEGYFFPKLIRQRWREHIDGVQDWQDVLWPILMFQSWLELE
jgi:asparagine synthase (glutamine-hydrolysing)